MWLIVVNPKSGRGKAGELKNQLVSLLKADKQDYKVVEAESASETQQQVERALEEYVFERLVAVGGDGLVNLCLQHIATKQIAITVIPAGTGNDFARAVGTYQKALLDIYRTIKTSKIETIDLGRISGSFGERWYVQVLSTGFDAQVNSLANQLRWPKGRLKYTIGTLLTLARFKPVQYEVDLDGNQFTISAMLLSVANGQTYGGGMRICPDASNSDGLFDIFIVKPVSRILLLTIFPKVFVGKHIPHPRIEILRAKKVHINAKTFAYADGEYVSDLPISISNVPNALSTWLMK